MLTSRTSGSCGLAAAVRQQPKPSSRPRQYLRHLSLGDRSTPKGLCRPMGAAVRAAEKAGGCGEYVKIGSADLGGLHSHLFFYQR